MGRRMPNPRPSPIPKNVYLVMWQGVHSDGRQQQTFNTRDYAQQFYNILKNRGRKVFLGGGSGYVYEWSGGFTEAEAGNWLDQAIYAQRKRNPAGPSAIPAKWTPATVSRKGGQIQIRMGGKRS